MEVGFQQWAGKVGLWTLARPLFELNCTVVFLSEYLELLPSQVKFLVGCGAFLKNKMGQVQSANASNLYLLWSPVTCLAQAYYTSQVLTDASVVTG